MPTLTIHRDHSLGLAKARKMAWKWAEAVEEKFGVECTVIEGKDSDVVEFTRSGLEGKLLVTASAFDLTARLGLLLGVFGQRIESEIDAKLDELLGQEEAKVAAAKGATAKAKRAKPAT